MQAWSMGNGQLHQVELDTIGKTLDCMHDKQAIILGGGEKLWTKIRNIVYDG